MKDYIIVHMSSKYGVRFFFLLLHSLLLSFQNPNKGHNNKHLTKHTLSDFSYNEDISSDSPDKTSIPPASKLPNIRLNPS